MVAALPTKGDFNGTHGTWLWIKDYIYRNGGMLAAATSKSGNDATIHYAVYHLGTPQVITNASLHHVSYEYWRSARRTRSRLPKAPSPFSPTRHRPGSRFPVYSSSPPSFSPPPAGGRDGWRSPTAASSHNRQRFRLSGSPSTRVFIQLNRMRNRLLQARPVRRASGCEGASVQGYDSGWEDQVGARNRPRTKTYSQLAPVFLPGMGHFASVSRDEEN